nr:MAG TPA: hypothetical protein [Caudoviricetes sp.]
MLKNNEMFLCFSFEKFTNSVDKIKIMKKNTARRR